MSKPIKNSHTQCPIKFALDVFGDRWTLLIIRDLVFKRKSHFHEFIKSPEKISTNILANRLAMLEAEGIVVKSVNPENASGYIYQLTIKGTDLIPVLLEMTAWSAKYDVQPEVPDNIIGGAPRHLLRRLRSDRIKLIREILDGCNTN